MFGFQISKWFWNLWDHLLTIVLLNLLGLTIWGICFLLYDEFLTRDVTTVMMVIVLGVIGILSLFLFTLLQHFSALVNYSIAKFGQSDWKRNFRKAWQKPSVMAALLFDILFFVCIIVYYISWQFYYLQGDLGSLFALGLLFWLALLFFLGFGFYFPLLVREEFSLKKAFFQSYLVCWDNFLLAIGLGISALFMLIMSFMPPIMLFWGFTGLGLWYEVSLRILYYKYEYLKQLQQGESFDDLSKKSNMKLPIQCKKTVIPWRFLLREERERIGPRSWRNFIFPWKD